MFLAVFLHRSHPVRIFSQPEVPLFDLLQDLLHLSCLVPSRLLRPQSGLLQLIYSSLLESAPVLGCVTLPDQHITQYYNQYSALGSQSDKIASCDHPSLEEMEDEAEEIGPLLRRLHDQLLLPPGQLHREAAELRLAVEVGPLLARVLAPVHHRHQLAQRRAGGELTVGQDAHLHLVVLHLVGIGSLEPDEGRGQPEIVDLPIDLHVQIRDSVQVRLGNQLDLNDLSSLRLAIERGEFLEYVQGEVLGLVLIAEVDAPLTADLVVDVEDDAQLVELVVHPRTLEGDLDVRLPDEDEGLLEEGHLVARAHLAAHVHHLPRLVDGRVVDVGESVGHLEGVEVVALVDRRH